MLDVVTAAEIPVDVDPRAARRSHRRRCCTLVLGKEAHVTPSDLSAAQLFHLVAPAGARTADGRRGEAAEPLAIRARTARERVHGRAGRALRPITRRSDPEHARR